ncbi:MAG TPA: MFS transporter [Gaiellaceae bacterium]|nr:MFS transporter [Gaiellaceae bacterium]
MIDRLISGRRHYAWLIVVVTFVTLITTAGFRATPGVLIVPLQNEFGWSRGTISVAVSIGLVLFGLTAPFSAALMERFGVRRVMLIALVTIATGASLTTIMDAPWQLDLLWGVVVGSATGAISVPLAATVANRWFESRRGFVTGILTASNASGQMVFLPALAWLATAYGWRYAAVAVAAVAIVVVLPIVAIFVRDRPQSIGLQPYGAAEPVPVPERSTQPFRPAIGGLLLGIRSPTFWLLSSTFFICGLSTNGLIGTHLIPAAVDHHLSAVTGASLLALMGLFDIVGTTCSGWLTDRVDPRRLLAWYYALRGLAVIALPYAFGSGYALVVFAVFYGLDWVATVPPTVMLTADRFGRERVGVVFGWIYASHQLGAGFAAWAGGATRTWFGTYTPAFLAAGALCLVASGLSLRIGRREGRALAGRPAPAVA